MAHFNNGYASEKIIHCLQTPNNREIGHPITAHVIDHAATLGLYRRGKLFPSIIALRGERSGFVLALDLGIAHTSQTDIATRRRSTVDFFHLKYYRIGPESLD